jgi:hypothetical protein
MKCPKCGSKQIRHYIINPFEEPTRVYCGKCGHEWEQTMKTEETKMERIEINGNKYVLESSIKNTMAPAKKVTGKPYVIVRTYSAGVFAGYLDKRIGQEATILKARRLWQWDGAASLSQLAVDGTKNPENCKFPIEVSKIEVTQAIEILEVTEKARMSIASVPIWQK